MLRLSSALPRGVESPATARQLCAATCREWELDHLIDDCSLLVSELVTNAVLHGNGVIRLELCCDAVSLHVAVRQGDVVDALPPPTMNGVTATTGRGLAIVDQVAFRWGSEADLCGTNVWFDLRV